MRPPISLLLILFSSLLPVVAQADGGLTDGSGVPAFLSESRFPSGWVAADVAVRSDGTLREDLLRQHAPLLLRTAREEAKLAEKAIRSTGKPAEANRDCQIFAFPSPGDQVPVRSAQELVRRAPTIVHGRVTAIRQGFLGGNPGSLLRLDAKYLRGIPADETYLFYPSARIETTAGLLCAKAFGGYAEPHVGDEFIIFNLSPEPLVIEGRTILWVKLGEALVQIPKQGTPVLPLSLRGDPTYAEEPVATILSLIANTVEREPKVRSPQP